MSKINSCQSIIHIQWACVFAMKPLCYLPCRSSRLSTKKEIPLKASAPGMPCCVLNLRQHQPLAVQSVQCVTIFEKYISFKTTC
jgi:hypothetical protein